MPGLHVKYHAMRAGADGEVVSIRISQQLLWFFSGSSQKIYTNEMSIQKEKRKRKGKGNDDLVFDIDIFFARGISLMPIRKVGWVAFLYWLHIWERERDHSCIHWQNMHKKHYV